MAAFIRGEPATTSVPQASGIVQFHGVAVGEALTRAAAAPRCRPALEAFRAGEFSRLNESRNAIIASSFFAGNTRQRKGGEMSCAKLGAPTTLALLDAILTGGRPSRLQDSPPSGFNIPRRMPKITPLSFYGLNNDIRRPEPRRPPLPPRCKSAGSIPLATLPKAGKNFPSGTAVVPPSMP